MSQTGSATWSAYSSACWLVGSCGRLGFLGFAELACRVVPGRPGRVLPGGADPARDLACLAPAPPGSHARAMATIAQPATAQPVSTPRQHQVHGIDISHGTQCLPAIRVPG